MRKQEGVIKLLRRLIDVIADEARHSPEFADRLQAILAPSEQMKPTKPIRSRRPSENDKLTELTPDLYAERNARTEIDFRLWLRDQSVAILRAFIRKHDLDATRRTAKWKDTEKLGTYIADQLSTRSTRGSSFMRGSPDL
jgi:hypothetical protein